MPCTETLQTAINFSQSFGGYKSLTVGAANEPAVTAGNLILQTVISPPFCWNWNRTTTTLITTPGVQDYKISVPDFGFIEKASFIPAAIVTATSVGNSIALYTALNTFVAGSLVTVTGTQNDNGALNVTNAPLIAVGPTGFEVATTASAVGGAVESGVAVSGKYSEIPTIQNVLGSGNEIGLPNFIAPQMDDNRGSITFRVLPIPDQTYQINIIYQKKIPALMTGPTSYWAPIPDHYAYIYQWGFAAMMMAYFQNPAWMGFSQKFVAALLGAAEGLEEEQRENFEAAWLDMMSERQAVSAKTSQGINARGSL